jgi:hypothetical protein
MVEVFGALKEAALSQRVKQLAGDLLVNVLPA